ncbi:DUF4974 domain-containing protein [Pigmentiphaga aceris]|uniref:DUF4974 domain-containing protein n=1 Tax=Pigmentiphaga aceris TaxID=1940612 RepID=A0A5C0AYZ1_9BURK|nr:FecR domain-containing protein [Pigmentiphaga aceris]QEI06633.1 DUF4974 domain-containing protein [Pigmentiphaga aceris]
MSMYDGRSSASDPAQPSNARALEDALAPFEEGLRLQLRSADDILRDAAARKQMAKRSKTVLPVLALGALCAGLVWLDPAYQTETVSTAIGQRATVHLHDGSILTLNTGSQVTVAMHLRSRRMTLVHGEALFDVAHAPIRALERPFKVTANRTMVHDIGTVFNVRTRDTGVDVSVLHGRVRVEAEDGMSRELNAGQAAATRDGHLSSADVRSDAADWRDGRLVLNGTPLRDVVEEIQRYRQTPVILQEGSIGDIRVSGQFELSRLDQLIDLLPSLTPVEVQRRPDGSVRIDARPVRR